MPSFFFLIILTSDTMRKALSIFFSLLVLNLLCVTLSAEERIAILSVNDMHAAMEKMPRLKFIADSLRNIYPNLLVLSAGDNRTGNPMNDQYPIPSYPMTELMNYVGFDASALGNHEFDANMDGLKQTLSYSHFPYLSANVELPDSLRDRLQGYKIFTMGDGVRVGVLGLIQINQSGIPDTHPKNVQGIKFRPVKETIETHRFLRKECDVVILLTHVGYDDDQILAEEFSDFADIIVGGHSHTKLNGGVNRKGVIITQVENKLQQATLTVIDLKDKKIAEKNAKLIDISSSSSDKATEELVKYFSNNEELDKSIGILTDSIKDLETMGCFMGQTWIDETKADFALVNYGSVRIEELPAGDIRLSDILRLDPFGNEAMIMELTGEELKRLILSCHFMDEKRFPFVVGVKYESEVSRSHPDDINYLTLKDLNGKKLNMKKTYRVVTSSYVISICKFDHKKAAVNTGIKCSDMMIDNIKKNKVITFPETKNVTIKIDPYK